MVELACLENKCASNGTEGSNPSLSASYWIRRGRFGFFGPDGAGVAGVAVGSAFRVAGAGLIIDSGTSGLLRLRVKNNASPIMTATLIKTRPNTKSIATMAS